MKVTRVQYTVRDGYAEQNRKNIGAVMSELGTLDRKDVLYAVYLQADGKTFMHVSHQGTPEAERFPTSLESFKRFQSDLKENLEIPPKVETFTLVQSSSPLF